MNAAETQSNAAKKAALLRCLKRHINGAVVDSMKRGGVDYASSWGVSLHTLRSAACEFAPDHDLALYLAEQHLRELRLAAYMIADPFKVTEEELLFWGKTVTNCELAESIAFSLLSRIESDAVKGWLDDAYPVMMQYAALLALGRMSGFDRKELKATAEECLSHEDAIMRNAAENILLKFE